jgi:hypothetical protein
MRLLFVAFAISFCALVWVAFSVARHILRHKTPGASVADAPLTEPDMQSDRAATPAKSHQT